MTRPASVQGKRWTFWQRFNIAGASGGVYLRRLRVIQTPLFSVYWHHIDEPDPDLDPHDHPWKFISFIVRGGYIERVWRDASDRTLNEKNVWNRFSVHVMPTNWAHRITEVRPNTVTLILAGPRVREWGFWKFLAQPRQYPSGRVVAIDWVPWQEYIELRGDTSVRRKEPMP